jgi:ring-1,2-phenylacetyl-CoA epoxidase subunit PaaD
MVVGELNKPEQEVYFALKEVMDPEIPGLPITELGIVTKIEIDGKKLFVQLTPTFSGCPALKIIEDTVKERLALLDNFKDVSVKTSFETQWTTDLITDEGRAALKKHGLTPPVQNPEYIDLDVLSDTPCPFCDSRNTTLKSPFGPTLCRSLHYCNNCLQGFEGFKPLM